MNHKIKLLFCAVGLAVGVTAQAQTPALTGHWLLKQKTVLSGPDITNGLPVSMAIRVDGDSLRIDRVYDTGESRYTIAEALALDGGPVRAIRETNGNIRTARLAKGGAATAFSVAVTYRHPETGAQTSADFTEQWAQDGAALTLTKDAQDTDGTGWSMRGQYSKLTEAEVAYRTAKGKGIKFTEGLSWAQIKEKARKENKYIFVDAYATWCGPCKMMERDVFTLNRIGDALNGRFIAVKVQLDSTKNDDVQVQAWRPAASALMADYRITAFPTYLFFDPQGNAVHKGLGTYDPDEFLALAADAADPGRQYYTLAKRFGNGDLETAAVQRLLALARRFNDEHLLDSDLRRYRSSHLEKLPTDSLLRKETMKLMLDFPTQLVLDGGTKSPIFKLLRERGADVDRLVDQPGLAAFYVGSLVKREEIRRKLYRSEELENCTPADVIDRDPDWAAMEAAIRRGYPEIDAKLAILEERYAYYLVVKDTLRKMAAFVERMDLYGPMSLQNMPDNAILWALFPHCKDPAILEKALGWMEEVIRSDYYGQYAEAQAYGCYAAILYQAGRKAEAIDAMEKQLAARAYTPDQRDTDPFTDKVDALERMKRGDKLDHTWKTYAFF